MSFKTPVSQYSHSNILGIIRYKIEYYESLQQDWIEEANAPDNLGPIRPRENENTINETLTDLKEIDDEEKYDGLEELQKRTYISLSIHINFCFF
jgi:hypothetical protein